MENFYLEKYKMEDNQQHIFFNDKYHKNKAFHN